MCQRLQKRVVKPEIILCSPAQRTRQTAERLIGEFEGTMDIVQFDERIYENTTDTLLDLIQLLPEACASAMVIGHNPSIGWLANQLSRYQIETMPSCAVASFKLPSFQWRDVGRTPSRLLEFDVPKK